MLTTSRYKYTVQTEGTSYSGRLKYLQLCNSALITHPLQWQEFHTHLLKISGPDMNYIETTENFGNLADAMEYYRVHDDEAEEIARNSYNTFARRYLTPAAVGPPTQDTYLDHVLTFSGHLLLETHVLVLVISPRLRAAALRTRQARQHGHARYTMDRFRRKLAQRSFHYPLDDFFAISFSYLFSRF